MLQQMENTLKGTVRIVFQPAEEGGGGMVRMIEEGLVKMEPKAQVGYGLHVWPS